MELTDEALLRRAVENCRDPAKRKGVPHPRWVAVMANFMTGRTSSIALCERFGFDPDEMVKR